MATGTLAPYAFAQFFDNNGDPLNAGKIYTYAAGTSTALATYSDVSLTTANDNPIVLDSAGRAGSIYLSSTSYKFILKTSADVTLDTQDHIGSVPPTAVNLDIDGTAGEAIAANDAVFLSDGSGGRTAGLWYKTDADTASMSSTALTVAMAPSAIASGASGTLRLQGRLAGFSALTVGSPYFLSTTAGGITSSVPTNTRLVGVADSSASLVITPSQVINGSLTVTTLTVAGAGITLTDTDPSAGLTASGAAGSNLRLRANGSVIIQCDLDNNGTEQILLRNGAGTDVMTVAETGNTSIAGTLTVTGATALNGGLTMDSTAFTVADTSGNTSIAGTLAVGGVVSVTGAGAHTISAGAPTSNSLMVRNTTSGTTAVSELFLGNNGATNVLRLAAFSTAFTSSGYEDSDAGLIECPRPSGLFIAASDVGGSIYFYAGGALSATIGSDGDFILNGTGTREIRTINAATNMLMKASGSLIFQVDFDNDSAETWKFRTGSGTDVVTIDEATGSIQIGGTAARATTAGTARLDIFDGTAPVGTLANGISLYSTAGELRVMDSAGNATLLSPHDRVTNEWVYDSVHTPTGQVVRIEMEKLVAEVERLSGKSFTRRWTR